MTRNPATGNCAVAPKSELVPTSKRSDIAHVGTWHFGSGIALQSGQMWTWRRSHHCYHRSELHRLLHPVMRCPRDAPTSARPTAVGNAGLGSPRRGSKHHHLPSSGTTGWRRRQRLRMHQHAVGAAFLDRTKPPAPALRFTRSPLRRAASGWIGVPARPECHGRRSRLALISKRASPPAMQQTDRGAVRELQFISSDRRYAVA
jgi:hypothetical protein